MALNKSNPKTRLNDLLTKLRSAGHRITPQRLAIINILIDSAEHLSVEQIYRQVQKDFPTTSLATVYNTLERLKEMGEVLELPFSDGSRYDGLNPHSHPHLRCTVCGAIEDVDIDLELAAEEVAAERGYADVRHRLEFYGVCPRCHRGVSHRSSG
ncbi:MAG: transcriptional repressor [Dehalococcoidia bacterium]|nr:MAG: transcriptional repressor [Dehalococcoidia bacterium]